MVTWSTGFRLGTFIFAGLGLALAACEPRRPDKPLPPPPPKPDPDDDDPSTQPIRKGPTPFPLPGSAHTGNVWELENDISSDGRFREVWFPDLAVEARAFQSQYVDVKGTTPVNGVFKYAPYLEGSKVTQDGFDQGQLYYSLSLGYHYLTHLGFDLKGILGSTHQGKSHPIAATANGMGQLNAYFSPKEDRLVFGTGGKDAAGNDKWHLAADNDVSLHETGHKLLHHMNPNLLLPFGGDGGAIHEGFGDALATLIYNDPELSEDFTRALGRTSGKDKGLRLVNNKLALSDVTEEVHDRGRVYAGFFWSVYERLKKKLDEDSARILAIRIAVNHGSNYTNVFRPDSQDFVNAVLKGVEGLERAGKIPAPLARRDLDQMILEEATRRKLVKNVPPAPTTNLQGAGIAPVNSAVTANPVVFSDIEAARKSYEDYSGGRMLFTKVGTVPFIGGRTEYYQQAYRPVDRSLEQRYKTVDVIGRTMHVRHDQSGKTLQVYHGGVRLFKGGEITEELTVSIKEAEQKAQEKITVELEKIIDSAGDLFSPTDKARRMA
ncbi:MAG: hypothetical protein HY539_04415, partial [Deltaproteobacteria bacterium]|nr:hypothetical protein [Deltaproteobacteria bacterium]